MRIPAPVRRAFFTVSQKWDYLLASAGERLAWASGRLLKSASTLRAWVDLQAGPRRMSDAVAGFRRTLLSVEAFKVEVLVRRLNTIIERYRDRWDPKERLKFDRLLTRYVGSVAENPIQL